VDLQQFGLRDNLIERDRQLELRETKKEILKSRWYLNILEISELGRAFKISYSYEIYV